VYFEFEKVGTPKWSKIQMSLYMMTFAYEFVNFSVNIFSELFRGGEAGGDQE